MIVDDEAVKIKFLELVLQEHGYFVVSIDSGEAAWQLLHQDNNNSNCCFFFAETGGNCYYDNERIVLHVS